LAERGSLAVDLKNQAGLQPRSHADLPLIQVTTPSLKYATSIR
jgi:hypothetical protein